MSATQTQTETLSQSGPVFAELNFFDAPKTGEKPHSYMYKHDPQRNYGDIAKVVPINDIRGHENEYSLDENGFQVVKFSPQEKEFRDEEKIKTGYYKEVEQLLKKFTGAYKVVIFDHTIRRAIPGQVDTPSSRGPVGRVHIDQTPWAGEERVRRHTGDEARQLLKERVQIIKRLAPDQWKGRRSSSCLR